MNDPVYISIDPDSKGGLAVFSMLDGGLRELISIPAEPLERKSYFAKWEPELVVIEKLWVMPKMANQSTKMILFGRLLELCEQYCTTIQVAPVTWQNKILGKEKPDGTKQASIDKAIERFGSREIMRQTKSGKVKPIHGLADALNIGVYAWGHLRGDMR